MIPRLGRPVLTNAASLLLADRS
ncbi:hypothetical protein CBM2585_B20522 [Cupriavidus taiwanensis]|nr:hypothetical protein CBM2585_B20522 [Cupriavidus taiwanensis]